MNEVATVEGRNGTRAQKVVLKFPIGLLGFEDVREFELVYHPEELPFLWLRGIERPEVAFIVVPPMAVVKNYSPDISEEDVEFLGLRGPDDAIVLNIVTIRGASKATVNLKGPIVINKRTLIAKQVIPINASEFPVNYEINCEP